MNAHGGEFALYRYCTAGFREPAGVSFWPIDSRMTIFAVFQGPLPDEATRMDGQYVERVESLPAKCVPGHRLCPSLRSGGRQTSLRRKRLRGFGGASVLEVLENYDGETYRAVYTVKLADVVYVLHVFQKKAKRRIAIPKQDIVSRRGTAPGRERAPPSDLRKEDVALTERITEVQQTT